MNSNIKSYLFWGVLIAPPLLAVFYAYKKPKSSEPIRAGQGIVLPPDRRVLQLLVGLHDQLVRRAGEPLLAMPHAA